MRLAFRLVLLIAVAALPAAAQGSAEVRIGTVLAPLPPGAVVVPFPHGRSPFGGTRIRLEDRLTVEVAALPVSTTPLQVYVDSLVKARNARAAPPRKLKTAVARQVNGRAAWVLRPACGDCQAVEVYLDFPGTRLVAAWGVDGLESLTVAQRHALAWALVASLHPVDQQPN